MTYPPQFFWNIETLWEQYFEHHSPQSDFYGLRKKYENPEISQNSKTQKFREFVLREKPNFTLSQQEVFEDEKSQKFLGLEEYSLCFQNGEKPVYFCDNHHQVLLPFWEVFQEQKKKFPEISGITVVHIDAHRDDAIFPDEVGNANLCSLQKQDIQKIISQCRVSDYLDAGKKIGLIDSVISLTQESEFEKFLENGDSTVQPYILNLDIDIYGPEGTAVSTALKTEVIAKAWSNADAVCFATSPGFIDADLAGKLGKIFY